MDLNEKTKDIDIPSDASGLSLDDPTDNAASSGATSGQKPAKHNQSDKPRNKNLAEHAGNKKTLWIGIAVLVLVVLLAGGLLIHATHRQPANNSQQQPQTAQHLNRGAGHKDSSQVKSQLNAASQFQEKLQKLVAQYRNATIKYDNDGNRQNFEQQLNNINNQRQNLLQDLKDNESLSKMAVGKDLAATNNTLYKGLNKSFNSSNQSDAVNAFNDVNQSISRNNTRYTNDFIQTLKQNHIKYSVSNNGNTSKINY